MSKASLVYLANSRVVRASKIPSQIDQNEIIRRHQHFGPLTTLLGN